MKHNNIILVTYCDLNTLHKIYNIIQIYHEFAAFFLFLHRLEMVLHVRLRKRQISQSFHVLNLEMKVQKYYINIQQGIKIASNI